MRFRRRRHFVDKDVQGALAIRVVAYWAACLWGIFCVLAGFPIIASWWFAFAESPAEIVAQTWADFWPAMLASLFVLPFLIQDVIRMSNRFVGPFFRLRSSLRQLAQGEQVTPIQFRKHDFWFDVAEDFNKILTRLAVDVEGEQPSANHQPQEEARADETVERSEELVEVPS